MILGCFDKDNLYKSPQGYYICFGNCTKDGGYNKCQDPERQSPEDFIKGSGYVS